MQNSASTSSDSDYLSPQGAGLAYNVADKHGYVPQRYQEHVPRENFYRNMLRYEGKDGMVSGLVGRVRSDGCIGMV